MVYFSMIFYSIFVAIFGTGILLNYLLVYSCVIIYSRARINTGGGGSNNELTNWDGNGWGV